MSLGELILSLAAASLLGVVLLAILARLNGADDEPEDGPPTILIGPAEQEPLGDQVDVRGILKRYAGD